MPAWCPLATWPMCWAPGARCSTTTPPNGTKDGNNSSTDLFHSTGMHHDGMHYFALEGSSTEGIRSSTTNTSTSRPCTRRPHHGRRQAPGRGGAQGDQRPWRRRDAYPQERRQLGHRQELEVQLTLHLRYAHGPGWPCERHRLGQDAVLAHRQAGCGTNNNCGNGTTPGAPTSRSEENWAACFWSTPTRPTSLRTRSGLWRFHQQGRYQWKPLGGHAKFRAGRERARASNVTPSSGRLERLAQRGQRYFGYLVEIDPTTPALPPIARPWAVCS